LRSLLLLLALVLAALTGSLELSTSGISAIAGEELSIPLTVSNPYTFSLTMPLQYSAPAGFTGWFEYSGLRVNSLTLPPGESAQLVFHLKVPEGAEPGRYRISLRAFGSRWIELRVAEPEEFVVALPELRGVVMEAGDKVELEVELRSLVSTPLELEVSCTTPPGWRCSSFYGESEVYALVLRQGAGKKLRLVIESSPEADVGEYGVELVLASSFGRSSMPVGVRISRTHRGENGSVVLKLLDREALPVPSAEVLVEESGEVYHTGQEGETVIELPPGRYTLRVSKPGYQARNLVVEVRAGKRVQEEVVLKRRAYYVELTAESPVVSRSLGAKPLFRLRLKNMGYLDDEYSLRVAGLPPSFYYRFKEEQGAEEGLSVLYLRGGEERTLYLEVVPPVSAEPGEYRFTAIASGRWRAEENLTLRLRGEYRLAIEPAGGYLSFASPGEAAELRAVLRNTGRGGTLTSVRLRAEVPEGWHAEAVPEEVPSLRPGEAIPVVFRLTLPADALPSEYMVKLRAEAEQSSAEAELRMVVRERGGAALAGALIILVTVAGLALLYRRLGRK